MPLPEHIRLMHAVLDGEATDEERRALEALVAADPAARAEFEDLARLFGALAKVPQPHPPEGLVASVLARLPAKGSGGRDADQLLSEFRVIGTEGPGNRRGRSTTNDRSIDRGGIYPGNTTMITSKRNRFVLGGVAAAVAAVLIAYAVDFPPGATNAVGTIVPAQRYRANQMSADDVKLGAPSAAQAPAASGNVVEGAGNAASADAVQRARLEGAKTEAAKLEGAKTDAAKLDAAASTEAVNQAKALAKPDGQANEIRVWSSTDAAAQKARAMDATNDARALATPNVRVPEATMRANEAVNQSVNQSRVNEATMRANEAATNRAVNQATTAKAANEATMRANEAATTRAVNQATTAKATNEATMRANEAATTRAVNQAATAKAANEATTRATTDATMRANTNATVNQATTEAVNRAKMESKAQ